MLNDPTTIFSYCLTLFQLSCLSRGEPWIVCMRYQIFSVHASKGALGQFRSCCGIKTE